MRQGQALHLRAVVGVAEHQLRRDQPVLEHLLRAVDVGQEQVERLHPLAHAGLDHRPVRGRDQARDHVERQDAVDRVAVAVDREGDALVVELGLGRPGPLHQLRQPQPIQAGADQLAMRALRDTVPQLAEMAGRLVAGERARRLGGSALRLDLHRPDLHAILLHPSDATLVPSVSDDRARDELCLVRGRHTENIPHIYLVVSRYLQSPPV